MDIDRYQFQVYYSQTYNHYIATVAEFPYLTAEGITFLEAINDLHLIVQEAIDILQIEGNNIPSPMFK
jgi:predicted RNase H-like HicB family nuclease